MGRKPPTDDDDTARATYVGLRLPTGLLARLDAHTERWSSRTGLRITRTEAVRSLLELGLDLAAMMDGRPGLAPDPPAIRELFALALEGFELGRRFRRDLEAEED